MTLLKTFSYWKENSSIQEPFDSGRWVIRSVFQRPFISYPVIPICFYNYCWISPKIKINVCGHSAVRLITGYCFGQYGIKLCLITNGELTKDELNEEVKKYTLWLKIIGYECNWVSSSSEVLFSSFPGTSTFQQKEVVLPLKTYSSEKDFIEQQIECEQCLIRSGRDLVMTEACFFSWFHRKIEVSLRRSSSQEMNWLAQGFDLLPQEDVFLFLALCPSEFRLEEVDLENKIVFLSNSEGKKEYRSLISSNWKREKLERTIGYKEFFSPYIYVSQDERLVTFSMTDRKFSLKENHYNIFKFNQKAQQLYLLWWEDFYTGEKDLFEWFNLESGQVRSERVHKLIHSEEAVSTGNVELPPRLVAYHYSKTDNLHDLSQIIYSYPYPEKLFPLLFSYQSEGSWKMNELFIFLLVCLTRPLDSETCLRKLTLFSSLQERRLNRWYRWREIIHRLPDLIRERIIYFWLVHQMEGFNPQIVRLNQSLISFCFSLKLS